MPALIILLGFLQFTPAPAATTPSSPQPIVPPGQMAEAPDGQVHANFASLPFAPKESKK